MTIFLVLGVVGLALLIVSFVLGEVLDGVADAGGIVSGPVIGSFLAAFGFGAALIMSSTSASTAVAALGGLGSGIAVGGVALVMTRSLMSMPTDDPVRSAELAGQTGVVITKIPAGGLGEVSLTFRGQLMKLSARSSEPIDAGSRVVVTAVTSPSSVVVEPAGERS